ncbi:MAG TPA: hypothetical protein VFY10_05175 [Dehalococcoidia bacterium]|jgi:hypothetical protein|nr:hypothetical protein [Dehalococcoidia bacterium]
MAHRGTACAIRGLLSSCGAEVQGTCVYCGRAFCKDHGVVLPNGEEVCSRKNCVAKRDDLARHLEYKDAVLLRNRQRLCGIESCGNEFAGQCARCKGYFCKKHAVISDDPALEAEVPIGHLAHVCKHCQARRAIWLKE